MEEKVTDEILYKRWDNNVFNCIYNISNNSWQTEAWTAANPNRVSSYVEDIGMLYDSFEFEEYIVHCEQSNVSYRLCQLFKELDKMLSDYEPSDAYNFEKILVDPEWLLITDKAKEVVSFWSALNPRLSCC